MTEPPTRATPNPQPATPHLPAPATPHLPAPATPHLPEPAPVHSSPPAAAPAPAEPKPPAIDDVFRHLAGPATHQRGMGYLARNPQPRLNPGQGLLQSRIFTALAQLGVKLPRQDDVYAWLLDQIAAALSDH